MPPPHLLADGVHEAPEGLAPCSLDRLLRGLYPGVSWGRVRRAIITGKVRVNGRTQTDPRSLVEPGRRVEVRMSTPRARRCELPPDVIVHLDRQVVVVRKPPGTSTVPFDDREQDSLQQLLGLRLARERVRPAAVRVVHRLDKETSGLLVFALTREAQRHLKHQFREHSVVRRYQAIAQGRVPATTFRSRLVVDRGDGRRGSTSNPRLGREATTHVQPQAYLKGATLLECRLETGRTHQIRIHLSEAGYPLLGERVYVRSAAGTDPHIGVSRLMLHAAELGFVHPVSGQRLHFEESPPPDFTAIVDRLRRS